MDVIFQTMFSNVFSWMELYTFLLRFHWSLYPGAQLTIFQHRFKWWLGTIQATSHYLNQWWLIYRRVYTPLGLNELTPRTVECAIYYLANATLQRVRYCIIVGIWLMIICYLAKIALNRYILHWFQYRNSYFEHPGVSENGARSTKMACCLFQFLQFSD